jgi:uncharacterized membrane protein required for colicin V production
VLFDLIAVAVLAVFVALGAFRGTLAGFLRVATVGLAYLSAFFAATKLGVVVAVLTGFSHLGAAALLGSGVFLFVYVAGSVISMLLIRAERDHRADIPRGAYDRFGGACFGALQAGLAILLLAVFGSVLDAAYRAGLPQGVDQSNSYLIASTRRVVARGVGAALGDGPGAKLAMRLVADPGQALVSAKQLLAGPRFAALQQDVVFWDLASSGELSIDNALNRRSFLELMYDDSTRAQMADLGLVPEAARNDPQAFRASLRTSLAQAGPRIRAIRSDPALAELAQDPEVQSALQSGNGVSLFAHPAFRQLIDRAMKDYERAGAPIPN